MNKKKPKALQPSSEAENFVEFERRKYAREWEISSRHLAGTGCYGWMADKLNFSGLLLEIGCGNGLSTIELLRRGDRVIAIEENTACLRRAKQAVEEANFVSWRSLEATSKPWICTALRLSTASFAG